MTGWMLLAWFALSLPAGITVGKLMRGRSGASDECVKPNDWGDAR
jgi:hypothetical protein